MISNDTINQIKIRRHPGFVCIIQIVGYFSLVDKPDSALDNITRENGKRRVGHKARNSFVHALLESKGGITLVIAVLTSWVAGVSGRISGRVGATADVFGTVVTIVC
jgi:hypothetical protein